jgi:hypothetical protein
MPDYTFVKLNLAFEPNTTCRLYLEAGGIIKSSSATHLTRWHEGATEETPALCEQALICETFSLQKHRVGYVYEDLDTLVALAVIIARYENHPVNTDFVSEIGMMIRQGPQLIPSSRYGAEIYAVQQIVSEDLPFESKLTMIQAVVEGTLMYPGVEALVQRRRILLEDAVTHSIVQDIIRGYVALIISDSPGALDYAMEYASIVIWIQPNAAVLKENKETGETYRKISVVRWDPLIPFDFRHFREVMSSMEIGSTGWTMTNKSATSPVNHNTVLNVRQVVAQTLMNRPRSEGEDASNMDPFIRLVPADWERLEAASRLKIQHRGE